MTKAAELAKMGEVLTNSQIGGRRNMVINGAMQVAQRGTSETGVGGSAGYFTVDRFDMYFTGTAGRLTQSQVAITDLPGFANALKLDCTTADTSIAAGEEAQLQYHFEGQDVQKLKKGTSEAEKVTVSFYVKGNASATYTSQLYDNDNNRINSQTFDVTTSWNRVILTFDGDTSGTLDDDNGWSFSFLIYLQAGSNFTSGTFSSNTWADRNNPIIVKSDQTMFFDSTDRELFITGLQIETGSQATPFEHRSYGEELALCQRYFHKSENSASGYKRYAVMHVESTTNTRSKYPLPVPMRAHPSLTSSGTLAIYNNVGGIINLSSISLNPTFTQADGLGFRDVCIFAVVSSGLTAGTIGSLISNNAVASLQFDSEL
jgi:hypothetical protein